jgi:anti-anti-sigma factor
MNTFKRIEVEEADGVVFVRFFDRKIITSFDVIEIGEELFAVACQSELQKVIIDFVNVEFLSSAMLNKFIIFDKKVKSKCGKLRFCGMEPEIREVFVITRLNQLFEIHDTREKALASMK